MNDIQKKVKTLEEAVAAMQLKIEQQIPVYKDEPLSQQVKVGTGETIIRANPTVQEFRATVRDYASALNSLKAMLTDNQDIKRITPLADMRQKMKIAK